MTIKNLTDNELLCETKNARSIEKCKIHEVLLHLKEILSRKLFVDLNYGSLHEYCMKELGYTSGEAAYRVSAVKLMRESKKIEFKIKTGELNLSNAVLVHNHFATKEIKPSVNELEKVVDEVLGKSKSQAKEILLLTKSKNAGITASTKKIKIKSSKEVCKDLLAELLQYSDAKKIKELLLEEIKKSKIKLMNASQKRSDDKNSRYIPSAVKAKVLLRAKGVCEQAGCKRRTSLEYEHEIPFARGGKNTETNIKLLCRLHNQRAAVKFFGGEKMNQFAFKLCQHQVV
jgi:hypothetical protein